MKQYIEMLKMGGASKDILLWSLKKTEKLNGYDKYKKAFSEINSDLSQQYTQVVKISDLYELKLRNQHCFQALFTENAIKKLYKNKEESCKIVDIGDSSGNHLKYLKYLFSQSKDIRIDGLSVNLDKVAVEKINASGGKAVLCRAEEYTPEYYIDFYLCYEMMEHLHNPAIFLYRLAKANKGKYMIVTVPYLEQSRVGLHNSSNKSKKPITAEMEHIFELSLEDWKKLCAHSGWKVLWTEVYFQYPVNMPIVSNLCKRVWKEYDFEGFLGMVLKRDMLIANRYIDWEE